VLGERSDPVLRAARNLERVHVVTPNGLNLLDLLRLPRVVLTESAVQELTRTLTRDLGPAGGALSGGSRAVGSSHVPREGLSGGFNPRAERSGPVTAEGGTAASAAPLPAEVTREAVVQEAEAEAPAEDIVSPEPAETAPTDEEHQP
jgi:hypothetical protein